MSSEALRLADWLDQNSSGIYRPAAQAASLLRTQAARIAELEAERDQLRAEVERLRTPLTDEQIAELADRSFTDYMSDKNDDFDIAFARAIEAAKEPGEHA